MVWIESYKSAAQATSLAIRSGHSLDAGGRVRTLMTISPSTKRPGRGGRDSVGRRDITVAEVDRPRGVHPRPNRSTTCSTRCSVTGVHMGAAGRRIRSDRGAGHHRGRVLRRSSARSPTSTTLMKWPLWKTWGQDLPGSARLPIEDLGELYGIEFHDDLDADTVGGLLAPESAGSYARPGSRLHGLRLRAERGSDHRGRVRRHRPGQAPRRVRDAGECLTSVPDSSAWSVGPTPVSRR